MNKENPTSLFFYPTFKWGKEKGSWIFFIQTVSAPGSYRTSTIDHADEPS